jgi:hypothetical protein
MSSNYLKSDRLSSLWKVYLEDLLDVDAYAVDSENTNPEDIKDDMELLNLLKGYLVQCAEKILDNPEELVKEVLKARDEEIKDLKKEIENLKKEIEELKRDSLSIGTPYPLEPNPWATSPYYPWSTSDPGLPLGNSGITYNTCSNANEAEG